MKVGRNEPCPCGSGKKYKQCCQLKQAEAENSGDELAWRRVRRALEGSAVELINFIERTYGDIAVVEAWEEFTAADPQDFDPDSPLFALFHSWWFYRWSPDFPDTDVADRSLENVPPASAYLQRKGKHLDPVLRRYVEAALQAPFTFYEVMSTNPGRAIAVREFFTGTECTIGERSASQSLRAGQLIFGSLVSCEGIVTIEGMGGYAVSPMDKLALIDFRQQYGLGATNAGERLLDLDIELIECYLTLTARTAAGPQLHNTDGDPIAPQTLIFDIDSAEQAFSALHDLNFEDTEAKQRAAAKLNARGVVEQAEIPWLERGNKMNPSWNNTALGRIVIDRKRMRVEVNSDARAERFRLIVESRLRLAARYRVAEKQSMERMLAEHRTRPPSLEDELQVSDDALMALPEVQDYLRKTLTDHYETWPDTPLPALDGKTPKQAVEDRIGREKVVALLDGIEHNPNRQIALDAAIIARLRDQLGIR